MTNFKERVEKEFDNKFELKGKFYDAHIMNEDIKSFIHQKMLELLEEVEGEIENEKQRERDRYIHSQDETESTHTEHKGYTRGLNYSLDIIKNGKSNL